MSTVPEKGRVPLIFYFRKAPENYALPKGSFLPIKKTESSIAILQSWFFSSRRKFTILPYFQQQSQRLMAAQTMALNLELSNHFNIYLWKNRFTILEEWPCINDLTLILDRIHLVEPRGHFQTWIWTHCHLTVVTAPLSCICKLGSNLHVIFVCLSFSEFHSCSQ